MQRLRRFPLTISLLAYATLGCVLPQLHAGNTAVAGSSVIVERDVPYLEEGRKETLDLYLPMPAQSRREAVVWIHGGGWAGGKKNDNREVRVSNSLANAGYVVASIDYQLATDTQPSWPQALLDCKNAVRFLRANAEKYNIDPDKIAVAGGSAGGHLALMVAYTTGKDGLEPQAPYANTGSEVAAVINLYGITNLLSLQTTRKDGTPTGRPTAGNMQRRLTGSTLPEGRTLWREASPVTHVKSGLPPTFISHGKRDTAVDYLQALELAQALKEQGVPHELVMLENTNHSYSLTHIGRTPLEQDLTAPVATFLEKAFSASAD